MDGKRLIDPALMESLGLERDDSAEAKLERRRQGCRRYYRAHKKAILARTNGWRRAHRKESREYYAKYRKANRSLCRKKGRTYARKASAELSDYHIRIVLKNLCRKRYGATPPSNVFPAELIEAKRAELMLKRKLQKRKLKHKGNHESQETPKPA